MGEIPTKAQADALSALDAPNGADRLMAVVSTNDNTFRALFRRGWVWVAGDVTDEGREALSRYRESIQRHA